MSLNFVTLREFGAFPFSQLWCPFFPIPSLCVPLFTVPCLVTAGLGFQCEWIFDQPSSYLLLCHIALSGLKWFMNFICLHSSNVKITLWKFSGHPERTQEFSSSFRTLYNRCILEEKRWGFFLVGYLGKSYFLTVNIRVPFIFDQWGGLLTGLRFLVYVVNSVWNSYPVHHTAVTGINLNNIYLFQISCIVMLLPCFSAASVIHQIIVQLVRCKIHLCTQCLYFLFLWIVGGLLSLCFK